VTLDLERRFRAGALAMAVSAAVGVAHAQELPLFRLFLTDGTVVACLGEYARVESSVVCSLPLDQQATATLVRLDARMVDWARSERYAESLRASLYAQSRGERDFAELSIEVATLLNEIGHTTDSAKRLGLALEARRRLAAWPAAHHNYRAADIEQILQLVEDAISDFRAAAGAQQFDLTFHAAPIPEPPAPLLPVPTTEQSMTSAVTLAAALPDATDRMSLLDAISAALSRPRADLPAARLAGLRREIDVRLAAERAVDRAYTRLATEATRRSRAAAARADVRGVERALSRVTARDRGLGGKRPDRVSAILASVQADLDAARRLRLARDQWAAKSVAYRSYRRSVAPSMGELTLMARGLDDIKRLAGPTAPALRRLAARAAAAVRGLGVVVPPADLAAIHALLVSAAQLAGQAVNVRQEAVNSGQMDRAWAASSAAAGALMLLGRAQQELARALVPPAL
jgi:hypothetical protein